MSTEKEIPVQDTAEEQSRGEEVTVAAHSHVPTLELRHRTDIHTPSASTEEGLSAYVERAIMSWACQNPEQKVFFLSSVVPVEHPSQPGEVKKFFSARF